MVPPYSRSIRSMTAVSSSSNRDPSAAIRASMTMVAILAPWNAERTVNLIRGLSLRRPVHTFRELLSGALAQIKHSRHGVIQAPTNAERPATAKGDGPLLSNLDAHMNGGSIGTADQASSAASKSRCALLASARRSSTAAAWTSAAARARACTPVKCAPSE